MWRPENWDKTVANLEAPRDEVFSDPGQNYDSGFYHGIEAGADAMLEELRKLGHHSDDGKVLYASPNQKGWLIFIPEE